MKKHFLIFPLLLSCILTAVFAAQAEVPEGNSIYAAAVQMTTDSVFTGGTVSANCPACDKTVTWEPLTPITAASHIETDKHYYLSEDLSNKTYYSFESKVCLHLNGHCITSSARAIYVETGARLNIMGDGTVIGKGLANTTCDRGGALDIAGTVNLYGGTYKHSGDYPVIASRGKNGGLNVYDGTRITGTSGLSGSNVRLYLCYLNVYGGIIENGIAEQGGNIYGDENAKVTIAGGTVTGGTVYMAEDSASLTLSGSPKVDVINLFDGPKAAVGGLTEGADIAIVAQGAFTEERADIADVAGYFRSPNELVKISVQDNALFGTVDTTGDSDAPLCDGKTLKLLCLTSSFGLNTTELLYDIAVAEGFEDVTVARLYASGCTLKEHVDGYNDDQGIYWYTKFTAEGKESIYDSKLLDGLLDEDWDIIFIQQGAEQTGRLNTYVDYLDQLMDIVNANKTNPNAKFIWNMTWAFQSDNTRKVFTDTFQNSQLYMHEKIIDAMQEKILTRSDFSAMIPTGAAVQSARTSYFGDRLTKDTLHLNNLGRVIAGYTVLATVTDMDLTDVNVGAVKSYDLTTPIQLSESDRKVVVEAVNAAREDPFAVHQSKYTPEYLNGIGAKAKELSFTGSDEVNEECPYCEKVVVWTPFTASSDRVLTPTDGNWGHYYLTEGITYSNQYIAVNTADGHNGFCLHLNGQTIKNTGKRGFWVAAGNTLNIMGNGTIRGVGEGTTESKWRGAALDVYGHVNLFGGIYTHDAAVPTVTLRNSSSQVNLFEGASIVGNPDYTVSLVNPSADGAEFNMWGGIVEDGTAVNGGNIYLNGEAVFNMFGGIVRNGKATKIGGNVYASNGTVNMYSGSIYGGSAENSSTTYGRGGNVALNGTSGSTTPAFYMYGGTIGSETVTGKTAGYASTGAANLYVAYGTADILGKDARICGGYSGKYGGNVMVGAGANITLTAGTVQNGQSDRGGNVYLAGTSSHFTLNGGTVADGTATSGGNFYVNNGYFTFAGGTAKDGTADTSANLYLKTGASDADNYALIHHDPTVSETAPQIIGGTIYCGNNVTLGTFDADSCEFSFASNCILTAEEGLVLENAAFDSSLLNLAGQEVSISGTGSVTGFDSANDTYETFGTVTFAGDVTLENTVSVTVEDKDYITVNDNGAYSFHRLDMAISAIGLKTNSNGMYYYANYQCDETLKGAITSYGIDYALYDAEGQTMVVEKRQSVTIDNSEVPMVTFEDIAIGSMNGIISNTNGTYTAAQCGQMKIEAVPFININGEKVTGEAVKYSMYDCCTAVDAYITELNAGLAAEQAKAAEYIGYMENLFDVVWAEYELGWNFTNFQIAESTEV